MGLCQVFKQNSKPRIFLALLCRFLLILLLFPDILNSHFTNIGYVYMCKCSQYFSLILDSKINYHRFYHSALNAQIPHRGRDASKPNRLHQRSGGLLLPVGFFLRRSCSSISSSPLASSP